VVRTAGHGDGDEPSIALVVERLLITTPERTGGALSVGGGRERDGLGAAVGGHDPEVVHARAVVRELDMASVGGPLRAGRMLDRDQLVDGEPGGRGGRRGRWRLGGRGSGQERGRDGGQESATGHAQRYAACSRVSTGQPCPCIGGRPSPTFFGCKRP